MNNDFLNQSIEFVKGVGPSRSKLLNEELNIKTVLDLLDFYPYRYIDRSSFYRINELPKNNSEVQIVGKIRNIRRTKIKFRERLSCEFYDNTGKIDLIWYRGFSWVEEKIKIEDFKNKSNQDKYIFIFGMPRSGTTLIEKIISSHSQVSTISESNFIPEKIFQRIRYKS